MLRRDHTRKPHVVLIHIFRVMGYGGVSVSRTVVGDVVNGAPFFLFRYIIITMWLIFQFAAIGRSIEQRGVAILIPTQVTAKSKYIVG